MQTQTHITYMSTFTCTHIHIHIFQVIQPAALLTVMHGWCKISLQQEVLSDVLT